MRHTNRSLSPESAKGKKIRPLSTKGAHGSKWDKAAETERGGQRLVDLCCINAQRRDQLGKSTIDSVLI